MSQTYTDLVYTNIPDAQDNFDYKLDVDIETSPLVDQYYTLINQKDFTGLVAFLEDNPKLRRTVITAEDWNRLRDAVIGLQRIFLLELDNHLITFSTPEGTWDKNIKYRKYNVVDYEFEHEIHAYIAMPKAITDFDIPIGTLPTDKNYWKPLTLRGEKGEPGTGLTPHGAHTLNYQYYANDLVSYDNCLWYALTDNYNIVPNRNSATWHLLMQFTGELLKFDNTGTTLTSTTLQNAVVELNNKTRIIKNIVIPMGGFINGIYTYKNPIISNAHAANVYYTKSSRLAARKADIEVETFDGSITFSARKLPSSNLEISAIILMQT